MLILLLAVLLSWPYLLHFWYMTYNGWCNSHLKSCHFQSVLFLTDSQSALALLSIALAFLQPKSFWDIWDLFVSLSSGVALSSQWVPGHAGLLRK